MNYEIRLKGWKVQTAIVCIFVVPALILGVVFHVNWKMLLVGTLLFGLWVIIHWHIKPKASKSSSGYTGQADSQQPSDEHEKDGLIEAARIAREENLP